MASPLLRLRALSACAPTAHPPFRLAHCMLQLRAFVVDEADAVLPLESFRMLMRRLSEALEANGTPRPQTILAGASIGSEHVQMAITEGWVKEPVIVTPTEITRTNSSPQGDSVEGDAAKDDKDGSANEGSDGHTHGAAASSLRAACELSQRVPSGSAHEYIVCDGNDAAIGTCCRLLRRVFTRREEASSADKDTTLQPPSDSAAMQESQLVLDAADVNDPPRVVVFTPSAEAAVSVATKLQAALWADVEGERLAAPPRALTSPLMRPSSGTPRWAEHVPWGLSSKTRHLCSAPYSVVTPPCAQATPLQDCGASPCCCPLPSSASPLVLTHLRCRMTRRH